MIRELGRVVLRTGEQMTKRRASLEGPTPRAF
jgi:hypothetical protein